MATVRRTSWACTTTLLAVAAVASCLPGPEVLRDLVNARLLLTGLSAGDRVDVVVGGDHFRETAQSNLLTFDLVLDVGDVGGTVRVAAGDDPPRCGPLLFRVAAGAVEEIGIDARGLALCTPVDPSEGEGEPEGEDPEGEDPEGEDPEGEDSEGEPEGAEPEGEPEGEDPEEGEEHGGGEGEGEGEEDPHGGEGEGELG